MPAGVFNELSAGERQRVLIARPGAGAESSAVGREHRFSGFEAPGAISVYASGLSRVQHLTVVFVTHDVNLAAQNADAILLLYNGKNML